MLDEPSTAPDTLMCLCTEYDRPLYLHTIIRPEIGSNDGGSN